MMDTFIKQILNISAADEWLHNKGLGWLISDRMLETASIIIGSLIIYFIGKYLIKWFIHYTIRSTAKHRSWHRKDIEKREKTLIQLSRGFWRILMIFYVAAIIANKLFLLDLSPLFASAGIVGVALGFGAQSLVKDFLSGIFIIAENQYRVGDVVDIMGASGKVERVGTRTTVVRDAEGNVHYVPNGTIQHVINKTMGYSISRFSLYLDPNTDISEATEIINATGEKIAQEKAWHKKIIDPPKFVSVGEITGRSTEIIISGKTQPSDQWAVTSEMRHRLLQKFDKEGILLATLPAPILSSKK